MARCEYCGTELRKKRCPSCELYNAAVSAQQAAAKSLAEASGIAGHAWVNEYGIFVQPDDGSGTKVLATPEAAKPFAELTTLARRVRFSGGGERNDDG